MRVKVGGKAIPASLLKIKERGRSLGRKTGERGIDKRIGRWSEPRSCSTPQEQERAREDGAKEISGEERLPEERWRRVSVSESLRGRESEEMTQSNISCSWGSEVPLEFQRGVMAIEVPQNEEISGGGKNGGRKGISSAIRWRGANRGDVHIKKKEREGVVKRDVDPYIIRVGIKRRKREGTKLRKG